MTYEKLRHYLWEELEEWGEIRERELKKQEERDPEEIPPDPYPQRTLKGLQEEISRRKKASEKPLTGKKG